MNVILLQNRAGFKVNQETEILDRIAQIWIRKGWAKASNSKEVVEVVEPIVAEIEEVGEPEVQTEEKPIVKKSTTKKPNAKGKK